MQRLLKKIYEAIYEVCKSMDSTIIKGGNFIRVRVLLDITLLLCHGHVVALGKEEQVGVNFKYECLPNLCYWCGRLTYDDKDCFV